MTFLSLLRTHGVNEVVDVRSSPYSRYNFQFNREAMEELLRQHGIRYLYLGNELGGRPTDPSCYDSNGRVLYDRVALTKQFHHGIRQLLSELADSRIALTCAEKDPLECHRTLLVAHSLTRHGVDGTNILHIQADGGLRSHAEMMTHLLDISNTRQLDMFAPPAELDSLIAKAIQKQAVRVAYVGQPPDATPGHPQRLV